jgi:hypothetical protein
VKQYSISTPNQVFRQADVSKAGQDEWQLLAAEGWSSLARFLKPGAGDQNRKFLPIVKEKGRIKVG